MNKRLFHWFGSFYRFHSLLRNFLFALGLHKLESSGTSNNIKAYVETIAVDLHWLQCGSRSRVLMTRNWEKFKAGKSLYFFDQK
jgi:hypothetical protein